MKGMKLRITVFAAVVMIALSEIFRAAILLTEYDYSAAAFAPVRAVGLIGVNLLIFSLGAFLIGRKRDDREFPSKLRNTRFTALFISVGTALSLADCIRNSILYPDTISASFATLFAFFLWLGIGSLMSLSEVLGTEKRNRMLRSMLSLAVSAISLAAYIFGWISAFYSA